MIENINKADVETETKTWVMIDRKWYNTNDGKFSFYTLLK